MVTFYAPQDVSGSSTVCHQLCLRTCTCCWVLPWILDTLHSLPHGRKSFCRWEINFDCKFTPLAEVVSQLISQMWLEQCNRFPSSPSSAHLCQGFGCVRSPVLGFRVCLLTCAITLCSWASLSGVFTHSADSIPSVGGGKSGGGNPDGCWGAMGDFTSSSIAITDLVFS